MNDHSQPGAGKISSHGNGIGVPSPDMIEKRAREIAMIDERKADDFTDGDWEQAHRELIGVSSENAPEETEQNAEIVEEWDMVAGDSGHRVPRTEEEEESVGEELVEEGVNEATHDQMVEARREELEEEGS